MVQRDDGVSFLGRGVTIDFSVSCLLAKLHSILVTTERRFNYATQSCIKLGELDDQIQDRTGNFLGRKFR